MSAADVRLRAGIPRPASTTRRAMLVAALRAELMFVDLFATLVSSAAPRTPVRRTMQAAKTSIKVKPASAAMPVRRIVSLTSDRDRIS